VVPTLSSSRTGKLRPRFERPSRIVAVALSNAVPFDLFNVSNNPIQHPVRPQGFTAHLFNVSPEFPRLYGLQLLAGRLLSHDRGEDTLSLDQPNLNDGRNALINAEAARRFGYSAGGSGR
jgi:putative ABC transport system permease protein